MENASAAIRSEFVRIVDGLVIRLHDVSSDASPERGEPGRMANLGHRLSDTLPSDLAEQMEDVVDELLTLCQRAWPDPVRAPSQLNIDGEERDDLDRLIRRWTRLKRNLLSD